MLGFMATWLVKIYFIILKNIIHKIHLIISD